MAKKKLTKAAKHRAQMHAPLVPGSPQTYGQTVRAGNAAAKLQYGPSEAALAQRQTNETNWFDQYKRDIAASAAQQRARYGQAVQSAHSMADTSAQQGTAQQGQLAQQAQADAASRGATYSGTPTQQGQAGTDLRHVLADAFASAIGAQGTAYDAAKSGQRDVGSAAQLSARLQTSKDQQTLKGQEGAYKTKYLADATDSAQKSVEYQQALGFRQQTEADTNAAKKAARVVSRKNNTANNQTSVTNTKIRTQAQKDAAKQRADQQAATKKAAHVQTVRDTSKGKLARLDAINGFWQHFRTQRVTELGSDGKPLLKDGKPVTRPPRPHEVTDRILSTTKGPDGKPFTPQELHLARLVRDHVPFSPADVALAHRLGIRVPRVLLPKSEQDIMTNQTAGPPRPYPT